MACYHPLKAFVLGLNDNGKKDLKITPYDTVCIYKPFGSDSWQKLGYMIEPPYFGRVVTEFIPIPCGQCVGCRLEYSRQWAVRCMLESTYHDNNYFVTLTYDDDNVPYSEYVDDDGVINTCHTLVKKDLQKFNKDLRAHLTGTLGRNSYRFYACGEYGSQTARPHFHLIMFGLDISPSELKFYKSTDVGNLYNCDILSNVWKKGHVVVAECNFNTCAYVSRYIMKKQKGVGASVYEKYNIEPEFVLMSRKPGIAKQWFDDNFFSIYDYDSIILPGGKSSKPPRYFDNLMSAIDEELMTDIKLKRADIALAIQNFRSSQTSADYQMELQHAENNKIAKISRLCRHRDI